MEYTIILDGVVEEAKAKFLPLQLIANKSMSIEELNKELNLELVVLNNQKHIVIGKDSEHYTHTEDGEEEQIVLNSIGYFGKIYKKTEDLKDLSKYSEDDEVDKFSFDDNLSNFNKAEVEFAGTESIFNVINLKLSGSKRAEKIKSLTVESNLRPEDIEERMKYLDKIGASSKMKEAVLNNIQKNPKDRSRIPNAGFKYIQQEAELISIIAGYNAGKNIMLEGDKASGKNTAIEDIAYLYNQPIYELQINGEVNNTDILGMKTIEPVIDITGEYREQLKESVKLFFEGLNNPELLDRQEYKEASAVVLQSISGGETEVIYEPSPLVEAMENGGLIVLDEINTGHPSILSILNPILDNRKRVDVPGYKQVVAHPDFRVFATMNTGYAGTRQMNSATHSRFMVVEFEPAESIRDIILDEFDNVEPQILNFLDQIYMDIVRGTRNPESSLTPDALNIRAFKSAIDLINQGLPVKVAFDTIATSTVNLVEREAIRHIIMAHLP